MIECCQAASKEGLPFADLKQLPGISQLTPTRQDVVISAIAGWRKVLGVLEIPVDLVEPSPGTILPEQALSVRTDGLEFAYQDGGGPVLRGIDVDLAAGSHVAIVGETGCGKTTFAKLLCRLADPTSGRTLIKSNRLRVAGIVRIIRIQRPGVGIGFFHIAQ